MFHGVSASQCQNVFTVVSQCFTRRTALHGWGGCGVAGRDSSVSGSKTLPRIRTLLEMLLLLLLLLLLWKK